MTTITITTTILLRGKVRIHRINTGSNVFIIEGIEKLVVIDAGYPGNEKKIVKKIKALEPKSVSLIFITHAHFDHYGSAKKLREATGAPIGIFSSDSVPMAAGKTPIPLRRKWGIFGGMLLNLAEKIWKIEPTTADITFSDGDVLDPFGIKGCIIHTPGHTKGSSSVLLSESIVVVGDLISTHPFIRRQCYYAESWEDIDRSIEKIKTLSPIAVYPGHGAAIVSLNKLMKL
jgi:glyoxylase-like metal-dependent hydrolase (beta-lactamase superfamily II)